MAGKVLSIYPGIKPPLADMTKPLAGTEPLGVGAVIGTAQDLARDLRETLNNVNKLLASLEQIAGDSTNQQHIAELLTNASEASTTTNQWLKQNREQMTEALGKLQETLDSADKLFKSADTKVSSTLASFDSTATQIEALTTSVRGIVAKLDNGQGTMGKLLNDDELYIRLNRTLAEVDSLAKTIRTKGLRNRIVLF
jgi:phospholipid/cholesterol/gamma-HCH transport system substrate-binding protein